MPGYPSGAPAGNSSQWLLTTEFHQANGFLSNKKTDTVAVENVPEYYRGVMYSKQSNLETAPSCYGEIGECSAFFIWISFVSVTSAGLLNHPLY